MRDWCPSRANWTPPTTHPGAMLKPQVRRTFFGGPPELSLGTISGEVLRTFSASFLTKVVVRYGPFD